MSKIFTRSFGVRGRRVGQWAYRSVKGRADFCNNRMTIFLPDRGLVVYLSRIK